MSAHKIAQYRLEMDQQKLANKLQKPDGMNEHVKMALNAMHESITQLLSQCDNIEKKYKELKLNAITGCTAEYRKLIRAHQIKLNKLTTDIRYSMKAWGYLVRYAQT